MPKTVIVEEITPFMAMVTGAKPRYKRLEYPYGVDHIKKMITIHMRELPAEVHVQLFSRDWAEWTDRYGDHHRIELRQFHNGNR